MNGARRGAPGAGAFGNFRPPPPPGSQFTTSRLCFYFYTHISMPNSAASSMASSSKSPPPTASRTGEGNGPVLYGLVPGPSDARRLGAHPWLCSTYPTARQCTRGAGTRTRPKPAHADVHAVPLASARQHPENQKKNQAGHSPERTVEGQFVVI